MGNIDFVNERFHELCHFMEPFVVPQQNCKFQVCRVWELSDTVMKFHRHKDYSSVIQGSVFQNKPFLQGSGKLYLIIKFKVGIII